MRLRRRILARIVVLLMTSAKNGKSKLSYGAFKNGEMGIDRYYVDNSEMAGASSEKRSPSERRLHSCEIRVRVLANIVSLKAAARHFICSIFSDAGARERACRQKLLLKGVVSARRLQSGWSTCLQKESCSKARPTKVVPSRYCVR
jgi:hypothetical protein